MAMVKIKSGKTVKVGSRSKSGGYEYEVQADGSIKNLTTGRTTAPATGKASKVQKAMPAAKAAATSKALTRSTAEKTAPIPKSRPAAAKAAPVPKTRPVKMTSAAARPEGPAGGMPRGTVRPVGFSKKRYSGGIFGLDIIKNN